MELVSEPSGTGDVAEKRALETLTSDGGTAAGGRKKENR